jgi:hypothetical protein
MGTQTEQAFAELMAEVSELQRRLAGQLGGPGDEQTLLEAHKWILSILQVAADVHVWADPARPRWVEIVGPYKKWGGDNADAFYRFAPIDPSRTYRVRIRPGDAAYLSLTVYGGPNDGRYSERIVGSVNDRQVPAGPDGTIEIVLSAPPPAAGDQATWLRLDPDAVAAITRDYLDDPRRGRRAEWEIEADDPPAVWREDDSDLARRLRAARVWVQDQAKMVPLALGAPNTVDEPYPVPTVTFGWAAGDLDPDQALVLTGRSPECAFWNLCLWNPFLHTYNYDYERVTINGAQVRYEPDGSWVIVIAPGDPEHANWVSTAGHRKGRIWFRWFLPASTPLRPEARLVDLAEVRKWA